MKSADVTRRWDFFISYTQADRRWAEWIAWVLEEAGYSVLIQAWDFVPGSNWIVGMDAGMRDATRTIAVLSDAYLESMYAMQELFNAWAGDPDGKKRKLLVVRVVLCERPGLLSGVVSVDLFGMTESVARDRLLDMVKTASEGRRKPKHAPRFPGQKRVVPSEPDFPGESPDPPHTGPRSEPDSTKAEGSGLATEPSPLVKIAQAVDWARRHGRWAAAIGVVAILTIVAIVYVATQVEGHRTVVDDPVTRRNSNHASPSGKAPESEMWSRPVRVDQAEQFAAVSCAAPSLCAAVDETGDLFIYNGTSWSAPVRTGDNLTSVSCPSVSYCSAVGYTMGPESGGYIFTFDGHSWSTPKLLDPGFKLHSISCASSSFCVAGASVDVFTDRNGVWTAPQSVDPQDGNGNGIGSISCVSTSFCLAVDVEGNALMYSNAVWPSPRVLYEDLPLDSVSCTSASFCLVVGEFGETVIYKDGTWSSPKVIDGGAQLNSVSCVSQSFCMVVDARGDALVYSDGSWSAPDSIDGGVPLDSVSCPTQSFCAAVDAEGNVLYLR